MTHFVMTRTRLRIGPVHLVKQGVARRAQAAWPLCRFGADRGPDPVAKAGGPVQGVDPADCQAPMSAGVGGGRGGRPSEAPLGNGNALALRVSAVALDRYPGRYPEVSRRPIPQAELSPVQPGWPAPPGNPPDWPPSQHLTLPDAHLPQGDCMGHVSHTHPRTVLMSQMSPIAVDHVEVIPDTRSQHSHSAIGDEELLALPTSTK